MGFWKCLSFVCFAILFVEPNIVHTTSCDDHPDMNCTDLLRVNVDMCKDHCIGELCQKTCGKCAVASTQVPPSVLECYQCAEMDNPRECNHTVSCPGDQSCIITQTFTANLEEKFQSGCVDNQVCQKLYQSTPSPGSKFTRSITFHGGCCASHLCNIVDPDAQTRKRRHDTQGDKGHADKEAEPMSASFPDGTFDLTWPLDMSNGRVLRQNSPSGHSGGSGSSGHDGGSGHSGLSGQSGHNGESGHSGTSGSSGESGHSAPGGTTGHSGSDGGSSNSRPLSHSGSGGTAVSGGTRLSSGHGFSIGGCVDIDKNYCQRHANATSCHKYCIKRLCPGSCNPCVSCYNCSHDKNPGDCKTIAECNRHEVCMTVESVSPDFTNGWKTSCSTVDKCRALNFTVDSKTSTHSSHVEGYCCSDSECNNKTVSPSHTVPQSTAKTTRYIAPSINTHVNPYATHCHLSFSGPCPTDFIAIGESCYYFGKKSETMNMTNAQAFCKKRCTRLLIISDHSEAAKLTDYIQHHIPHLFDSNTVFWTDMMKTIKHGHLSHTRWASNSTGTVVSYHDFDGHPDHANADGEMCMDFGPYEQIDNRHHEYYVGDRSCSHSFQRPMCEYSNNNKL